jgi:hypothetical protein
MGALTILKSCCLGESRRAGKSLVSPTAMSDKSVGPTRHKSVDPTHVHPITSGPTHYRTFFQRPGLDAVGSGSSEVEIAGEGEKPIGSPEARPMSLGIVRIFRGCPEGRAVTSATASDDTVRMIGLEEVAAWSLDSSRVVATSFVFSSRGARFGPEPERTSG